MKEAMVAGLLGGISVIALASGGIFIDTWEFWVVLACLFGMNLNASYD